MREVRTCDFCGDDATGLYEPLPATIPDSPRLLLCDACHDTLSTVIDPLIAQVAGEGAADTAAPSADGADAGGGRQQPAQPLATDDDDASGPAADAGDGLDSEEGAGAQTQSAADSGSSPGADVDVGTSRDAGGRDKSERGGAPRGYRRVMRFLENRELPIERAEAERMAVEAYDLDEDVVTQAIDHAVQYGRYREVGGELKR